MRVVGGHLKGRALAGPKSGGLRPTSDKVRQALFNILEHGIDDFELNGAHVLDLFAGTGALGLEALSRGATFCVFVEQSPTARAVIQDNLTTFGLGGTTRIFRLDATSLGPSLKQLKYSLLFLDPPYNQGLAELALASAHNGNWVETGAIAVVEEDAKATVELPDHFRLLDQRTYGTTQIVIARYTAVPDTGLINGAS